MNHDEAIRTLKRNPDARITIDDPYENRVNPGPDERVPAYMAQEHMSSARGLVTVLVIACLSVAVMVALYAIGIAIAWLTTSVAP